MEGKYRTGKGGGEMEKRWKGDIPSEAKLASIVGAGTGKTENTETQSINQSITTNHQINKKLIQSKKATITNQQKKS